MNPHEFGSPAWWDEYLRGVVTDEMGKQGIELRRELKATLIAELGGGIPQRVQGLEKRENTRQVRTIGAAVVLFAVVDWFRRLFTGGA